LPDSSAPSMVPAPVAACGGLTANPPPSVHCRSPPYLFYTRRVLLNPSTLTSPSALIRRPTPSSLLQTQTGRVVLFPFLITDGLDRSKGPKTIRDASDNHLRLAHPQTILGPGSGNHFHSQAAIISGPGSSTFCFLFLVSSCTYTFLISLMQCEEECSKTSPSHEKVHRAQT
jgi:hypothetical protein